MSQGLRHGLFSKDIYSLDETKDRLEEIYSGRISKVAGHW
jgi:hypothetical protein